MTARRESEREADQWTVTSLAGREWRSAKIRGGKKTNRMRRTMQSECVTAGGWAMFESGPDKMQVGWWR